MEFRINTKQFYSAVVPAADVASKNIRKYENKEVFCYAYLLAIEASSTALTIRAYGGWASISVTINESEGYVCQEAGIVTVKAIELIDALKSFSSTANLSIWGDAIKLMISREMDQWCSLELHTFDINVECPRLPRKAVQEATVNRDCFIRGMKKVAWAMCKNEKMATYMCTMFEAWDNKMRFTAGSGGRFATFEINDCQSTIVDEDVKILFPSYNIGNLNRVFGNAGGSTIKIRTAEWNSSLGIPEQLVLESNNIIMALYGTDPYTKYPDLDGMLHYDHTYQIPTHTEDWDEIAKAIHASRPGHDSGIHDTRIMADLLHGYFNIRTNTKKQVHKRVNFVLGGVVADTSKDKAYQPWFACNSDYIEDIARKGYKDGIMTINFDDQAKLDDIPKDKPKQMKPVLVTYSTKTNKDGTKEKYSIFFTVSVKW